MYWLVWLVVGLVSWWAMGQWAKGNEGWGGKWAALVMSLVGAGLGDFALGDWLWMLEGYNVVAGLIGAVVVNWLWGRLKNNG